MLEANRSVTEIYLHGDDMGPAGVKACRALAEALKANRTITEIDLSNNNIGDAGAEACRVPGRRWALRSALAEALKANRTITEIDLSNNNIGDAGAEACRVPGRRWALRSALAEALKANRTVRRIRFQNNNIGDAGAKACRVSGCGGARRPARVTVIPCRVRALAEALKANRTITEIDFSENNIGDAGAKACHVAGRCRAPCLDSLPGEGPGSNFDISSHPPNCDQVLAAALYSNRSVKEIDLSHNHIGDAGAEACCVPRRPTARCPSTSQCFDPPPCEGLGSALAKALKANRAVTEISLYDNDISNAGYKACPGTSRGPMP
eukprot:Skav213570  [mRNA]  locus=scaffold1790:13455:20094:- [translate_table: standard]